MNDLADSTFTPALLFLADWSLRWGAITGVLLLGLAVRPPRRPATRLMLCEMVLLGGLALPFVPRLGLLTIPFGLGPTASHEFEPAPWALPVELPIVVRARRTVLLFDGSFFPMSPFTGMRDRVRAWIDPSQGFLPLRVVMVRC